jgi:Ca-activated chloride channel family protein
MKHKLLHILQILSIGLFASVLVFSQAKTVSFRVSVADKNGKIVGDLRREHFSVKEDGKEQEISYFSDKEEPASVVVLMDLSDSIDPEIRRANAKYAWQFIDASHAQNEYSVVGFHESVVELAGWKASRDKLTEIFKATEKVEASKGQTHFYDALMLAFEKLKTSSYGKKIVLIFSDGVDNQSELSFKKIHRELKRNDVTVYAVSVAGIDDSSISAFQGQAFLNELAILSGGAAYFPQTFPWLDTALENVVAAVKNQYVIGYVPKDSKKNKDWHSVKIKVSATDTANKKQTLTARTREGYFVGEGN